MNKMLGRDTKGEDTGRIVESNASQRDEMRTDQPGP